MASTWLQTGSTASNPNVGDQGRAGDKRSATGQKVIPNVEALVDAGGTRGEEKPVVEGLEDDMEAALLRLLSKQDLIFEPRNLLGQREHQRQAPLRQSWWSKDARQIWLGILPLCSSELETK